MINSRACFLSVLTLLVAATASAAGKYKTMYEHFGWDVACWPKSLPVTAENYPKVSLENSLGFTAKYDTLVYSPMLGFGMVGAKLASSDFFEDQPAAEDKTLNDYGWHNGLPELCKRGTDAIKEAGKWARAHNKEFVIALPLNFQQLHGMKPNKENPAKTWRTYFYPPFKAKNQGCVIDITGAPKGDYGPGSVYLACDYDRQPVVDKYLAIAKEIAEKYDMDGIMMDFVLTTPVLFGSVAKDKVAADAKQLAKITAMVDAVKAAVDAASARLKKKVTFSVRVPDSPTYCKAMGADITAWLEAKKLDYVVFGARFQCNPWKSLGDYMSKYSTPYYIAIDNPEIYVPDDSGHSHDDEQIQRVTTPDCHCAQIADMMSNTKASGVLYSGQGHWEGDNFSKDSVVPYDPGFIRTANKRYFVTPTRMYPGAQIVPDGEKFFTGEQLYPGKTESLEKTKKYHINVADDFAALKKDGITPEIRLVTHMSIPSGIEASVTLNGKELKPFRKRSEHQYYKVPLAIVKTGANEIIVKAKGANRRSIKPKIYSAAIEVEFPGKEGAK